MLRWLFRKKSNREIIINAESLETRVAVMAEGKLEEFQIEYSSAERIVGSIFKGRIQNLEHDLQAAFVDIGLKKNAFLHYWDMIPEDAARLDVDEGRSRPSGRGRRQSKRSRYSNAEIEKQFPPGSEIVVQVTKGPIGTKGPRVTANLSIPGRYIVMLPGSSISGVSRKIADGSERKRLKELLDRLPIPQNIGIIVRTVASGSSKTSFVRDLRGLLATWSEISRSIETTTAPFCVYQEPDLVERVVRDWMTEDIDRITIDSPAKYARIREVAKTVSRRAKSVVQLYEGDLPIFQHFKLEKAIEEVSSRKVHLHCGGYLIFDETEAMIAIDVNTGRHKGKGSQEDAILEVNTEAVEEVARQLRLRNLGGIIVLDLVDMKSRKHQHQVFKAMKAALKKDRARTNVLPISELGLLEMTRQRYEESMSSVMHMDCPYCKGRGTVRSPLGMSVEIQRALASLMRKMHRNSSNVNLQIVIHPSLLERLRSEDEQFLIDLQERFDGKLSFKSDPSRHVESFAISNSDTGEPLYVRGEKQD